EAVSRNQCALDDLGSVGGHVLHAEADAVADLEPGGIGECDLLVEPVGVLREPGRDRALLHDDGVEPAARDSNVTLEVDSIAEPVSAGEDPYGAAAPSCDGIDGGLNGLLAGADDVRILRADRERAALAAIALSGVAP